MVPRREEEEGAPPVPVVEPTTREMEPPTSGVAGAAAAKGREVVDGYTTPPPPVDSTMPPAAALLLVVPAPAWSSMLPLAPAGALGVEMNTPPLFPRVEGPEDRERIPPVVEDASLPPPPRIKAPPSPVWENPPPRYKGAPSEGVVGVVVEEEVCSAASVGGGAKAPPGVMEIPPARLPEGPVNTDPVVITTAPLLPLSRAGVVGEEEEVVVREGMGERGRVVVEALPRYRAPLA